jgi:hypothetical protein
MECGCALSGEGSQKDGLPKGDKAMTNTFVSKFHRSLLAGVFAIGALASASHAVAQQTAAMVNVPFDFQSGSRHFPAGTYRIDLQLGHIMLLRGTASNASGFAMTYPEQRLKAPETGKVVFQRYGDHAYIREVWIAGETTGYRCPTSREEKHDQKLQIAMNSKAPSNAEVALNAHR